MDKNRKYKFTSCPDNETKLGTLRLGFFLVIAHFLQLIDVIRHVDENTTPPRQRKDYMRLSHGMVVFVLCLYLFDATINSHPIYRLEDWVESQPFLRLLFPTISPGYFTEDRVARALDAIGNKVGDVTIAQSIHIVEKFKLSLDIVYVDLTNFTLCGDYKNQDPLNAILDYAPCPKSGNRSKKVVSKLAIATDDGVPIYNEVVKGSDPDVSCYPLAVDALRKILGENPLDELILVADSKSMSEKNRCMFDANHVKYVGMRHKVTDDVIKKLINEMAQKAKATDKPAASSESAALSESAAPSEYAAPVLLETVEAPVDKEDFVELDKAFVRDHRDLPDLAKLLQSQRGKSEVTIYTGADIERWYIGSDKKKHYLRDLLICSSKKQKAGWNKIERNLATCEEELKKMQNGVRRNCYDDTQKIYAAFENKLKENSCQGFFTAFVTEETIVTKKADKKGPHTKDTQFTETTTIKRELTYTRNLQKIEEKKELCGYFILQTNMNRETADNTQILKYYKGQDKIEKTFMIDKSILHTTPLWLKTPVRIKGLMFAYATLTQMVTLFDREIVLGMEKYSVEELSGIIPDKDSVHPHTPYIKNLFENVHCIISVPPQGNCHVEMHELSENHKLILKLSGVPNKYYSPSAIGDLLTSWQESNPDDFYTMMDRMLKISTDDSA